MCCWWSQGYECVCVVGGAKAMSVCVGGAKAMSVYVVGGAKAMSVCVCC